ncbi:MAG: winged helix-turn-helix domain-containing protein [Candidatus Bathyarchaeota archaeon]|nr:winged helix-turn-helix domain-containing protein [Candidatus Bathyarchaeota archaeon]MDH5788140.1 winged helix-turn-helix domain-containing protein [Candidatus Bathyarchaeota archaeon]
MKLEPIEKGKLLRLKESKVTRRRRDRRDIIVAILKTARNGVRKTHLMKKVGMSYSQLKLYLKVMKKADLREKSDIWETTEKGFRIVEACEICYRLAKEIS